MLLKGANSFSMAHALDLAQLKTGSTLKRISEWCYLRTMDACLDKRQKINAGKAIVAAKTAVYLGFHYADE